MSSSYRSSRSNSYSSSSNDNSNLSIDAIVSQAVRWDVKFSVDQGEASAIDQLQKSAAEIAQYSIDPALTPLQVVQLYLKQGLAVQQCVAVKQLPHLLSSHTADVVLPLYTATSLQYQRWEASTVQLLVQTLVDVIGADASNHITAEQIERHVLPLAQRYVLHYIGIHDLTSLSTWLPLYCAVTQRTTLNTVTQQVVPQLVQYSNVSLSSEAGRYVAAHAWSSVVDRCLQPAAAANTINHTTLQMQLHQALHLCQDTSAIIRGAMAVQLSCMLQYASQHSSTPLLDCTLAELKELLADEELQVQGSALKALCHIIAQLPQQTVCAALLVERLAVTPPALRSSVGQHVGNMLTHFTKAQWKAVTTHSPDLQSSILAMATLLSQGNSSERNVAAQLLPAVVTLFSDAAAPSQTLDNAIASLMQRLADDSNAQVRLILATGLPAWVGEVPVRSLQSVRQLVLSICSCTGDEHAAARHVIMQHLPTVMSRALQHTDKAEYTTTCHQLTSIFTTCLGSSLQWRLVVTTLQQVPWLIQRYSDMLAMPPISTPTSPSAGLQGLVDQLYTPTYTLLSSSTSEVRAASSQCMAHLLAASGVQQRHDMLQRMLRELAESQSCYKRMTFLDVLSACCTTFSAKWFKRHLLQHALNRADDSVPAVRAKFVSILPALQSILRIHNDAEGQHRLATAVSTLQSRASQPSESLLRHALASSLPQYNQICASNPTTNELSADHEKEVVEEHAQKLHEERERSNGPADKRRSGEHNFSAVLNPLTGAKRRTGDKQQQQSAISQALKAASVSKAPTALGNRLTANAGHTATTTSGVSHIRPPHLSSYEGAPAHSSDNLATTPTGAHRDFSRRRRSMEEDLVAPPGSASKSLPHLQRAGSIGNAGYPSGSAHKSVLLTGSANRPAVTPQHSTVAASARAALMRVPANYPPLPSIHKKGAAAITAPTGLQRKTAGPALKL